MRATFAGENVFEMCVQFNLFKSRRKCSLNTKITALNVCNRRSVSAVLDQNQQIKQQADKATTTDL